MKVLVLGGYGVFGGRLARMLLQDGHRVLVAGRDIGRAGAFCRRHGGAPVAVDRDDGDALKAALTSHAPDVLVDAAGPFQAYGDDPYRIARAALASGAHYLDLSDDAGFTEGIGALDATARTAGLVCLSGLSSVPALSSAVVAELATGLAEIGLIETAILPGNRAPRGLSVMTAILGQAGAPLHVWRGGQWTELTGWSGRKRIALAPGLSRPAAFIGAPDLRLFPERFDARSVLFRAGLELRVLHDGLALLAWLRRHRVLPDLARFARPLRWMAGLFRPFGTDRGGMRVTVAGRDGAGHPVERAWTLLAEAGDGPSIPAIPARIQIAALAVGDIRPGARPALCAFSLQAAEAALSRLNVTTSRQDRPAPRLFAAALDGADRQLPAPVRRMHDLWDWHEATGTARAARGKGLLSRLIGAVFRFPAAGSGIPLRVTMECIDGVERWTRHFGPARFASTLSPAGPGAVHESFGPFRFRLALSAAPTGLTMTVTHGAAFGIPLPRALLPVSTATETAPDGIFRFDVHISLPFAGLLVHYTGTLTPTHLEPPPQPAL